VANGLVDLDGPAGRQPNNGNIPPQPMIRYCWPIEKIVEVIQYRNRPAGRKLP